MIYRYKLKECEENKNFNSRRLEGLNFYKDKWIYSGSPLVLAGVERLVTTEKAKHKEDFNLKTVPKAQKQTVEEMTKPKEPPVEKKKTIKEWQKEALLEGFTKKELKGLTISEIKVLLDINDSLK